MLGPLVQPGTPVLEWCARVTRRHVNVEMRHRVTEHECVDVLRPQRLALGRGPRRSSVVRWLLLPRRSGRRVRRRGASSRESASLDTRSDRATCGCAPRRRDRPHGPHLLAPRRPGGASRRSGSQRLMEVCLNSFRLGHESSSVTMRSIVSRRELLVGALGARSMMRTNTASSPEMKVGTPQTVAGDDRLVLGLGPA